MTLNEDPSSRPGKQPNSVLSSAAKDSVNESGSESESEESAGSGSGPDSGGSFWSLGLAPFRKAVFRGLAVVMPPLLTIVLFIWAWNTLNSYVFSPIEATARYMIVWSIQDIQSNDSVQAEIKSLPRTQRSRHQRTAYRETYRNESGQEMKHEIQYKLF